MQQQIGLQAGITIVGDSLIAIRQFQGRQNERFSFGNHLCRHIMELLYQLETYSFFHIPRSLNAKADRMANLGVRLTPGTLEINGNITAIIIPP